MKTQKNWHCWIGAWVIITGLPVTCTQSRAETPELSLPSGMEILRKVELSGPATEADTMIRRFMVSPDRKRYCYNYPGEEGDVLVLDGEPIAIRHARISRPGSGQDKDFKVFSPDGRSHLCLMKVGATEQLMINGESHSRTGDIDIIDFMTAETSGVAFLGGGAFVAGGHIGEGAGQVVVSPDGKRFAYVCYEKPPRKMMKRTAVLVVDGKKVARSTRGMNHMVFSQNGKAFACVVGPTAKVQKEPVLYLNGKNIPLDDGLDELILSPDGTRWAAIMKLPRARKRVILDGRTLGDYDRAKLLTFSPDGDHLAFVCGNKKERVEQVVLDGKVMTAGDRIDSKLVFSPDSKHLACVVRKGGLARIVVDGKGGQTYAFIMSEMYRREDPRCPRFSADSSTIYYWASVDRGTWILVGNGDELVEVRPFGNDRSAPFWRFPSSGNEVLISGAPDSIRLLSDEAKELVSLKDSGQPPFKLEYAFLRDGRLVEVASRTDSGTGEQIARSLTVGERVLDLASVSSTHSLVGICKDSEGNWFTESQEGDVTVTVIGKSMDSANVGAAYWIQIDR